MITINHFHEYEIFGIWTIKAPVMKKIMIAMMKTNMKANSNILNPAYIQNQALMEVKVVKTKEEML